MFIKCFFFDGDASVEQVVTFEMYKRTRIIRKETIAIVVYPPLIDNFFLEIRIHRELFKKCHCAQWDMLILLPDIPTNIVSISIAMFSLRYRVHRRSSSFFTSEPQMKIWCRLLAIILRLGIRYRITIPPRRPRN